ncbi:hypothetical protein SKAU_G00225350 [Synaphobranchus kaupii]|uniref:TNFR-Cys domain-containing protein n=1 Tax=Synaphobranchus kaupii TaxID=118154 RepID=A0A9Q1FBJ8_SYNKA|nr:hypothetical protein SKAU_G00225350 [Synaphobranchus kaupii]
MTDEVKRYTLTQKRNRKERTGCCSERCGLQCVSYRMEIELLCLEMLMLLARVTSALPTDAEHYYTDDTGRLCRRCPPGQYQANCGECSACQPEFFTYEWNIEASCLPCHRDCRKEFNLRVVKTCSAVSDVLCSCIDGYTCKDYDGTMKQCKYCLMDTPPTLPPEDG